MAGQLSDGTTVIASNLSVGGLDSNSAAFGRIAAMVLSGRSGIDTSALTATSRITTGSVNASSLTIGGGLQTSGLTLDLRSNLVVLSLDTRANASGMTTGQLRLIFAASGISLLYSSGATQYTIAGSSTSAVQS